MSSSDRAGALSIIFLKLYALAVFIAIAMTYSKAEAADWPTPTRTYNGGLGPVATALLAAEDACWTYGTHASSEGTCGVFTPSGATGSATCTATCSGGAADRNYTTNDSCAGGSSVSYSTTPPGCVNNTCTTNQGKYFDFDFSVTGASVAFGAGSQICQEGCRADVVRGGRFDITLADGTIYGGINGTGRISAIACDAGNMVSTRTGAFRNNDSTPTAQGSQSTGVSGGTGQNDGQGANIARIATNTARILDALEGVTGGGSTTAPASTADSGCGRPGQPKCAIDEGDTATHAATVATSIAGAQAATEELMDARLAQVAASNAEGFGAGSRWVFSAVPFFGGITPTCSLPFVIDVPSLGMHAQTYTLSVCSWTARWHGFAEWALYFATAIALWMVIYGKEQ